jgi:uncharacterized membrane protein
VIKMSERPELEILERLAQEGFTPNGFVPPAQEPPEQTAIDRRADELILRVINVEGLGKIKPPVPLVGGYLFRDSLAWLQGKWGNGKTFVAVDLACCVGTGTPWHGQPVTQGRVLYLMAEGVTGLAQRVDAWMIANGKSADNVLFLPVPVQVMSDLDLAALRRVLTHFSPLDLVVLDTQARVTVGADENSSRDMGRFVDNLEILRRQTGACIMIVHHEPRAGENLRGSTALEGGADTIIRVTKDGDLMEITNPKQKDAAEMPTMELVMVPIADSLVTSHSSSRGDHLTGSEREILSTLRESFGTSGARSTELEKACSGVSKASYFRGLKILVDKGLMLKTKEGRSIIYSLPADTRQDEIT